MSLSKMGSPSKTRTACNLIVFKAESYELHLVYKNCKNVLDFYSNTPYQNTKKPPWGQIKAVEFIEEFSKDGIRCEYLKLENGDETIKVKIKVLQPLLGGITSFGRAMNKVLLEKGPQALATFLDLLVSSGDGESCFGGFEPEEPWSTESLKEFGADESFDQFVAAAKESAIVVLTSRAEALDKIAARAKLKSKLRAPLEDEDVSEPKKIREEIIEDGYQSELIDNDGLEKGYRSSIVARRDVNIGRLSLPEDHPLQIDHAKVDFLVKSMKERLDETQLVLTVCPEKPEDFDPESKECLSNCGYTVLHGVHRLKALQKISPPSTKVTCWILFLKGETETLKYYAQLRGNELATVGVRKPYVQELLIIMQQLKVTAGLETAQKVTERYSRLMKLSKECGTALKKYSKFTDENLILMVEIIKQYEVYGTKDAFDKVSRKKSTHEKLELPKRLFIALSNLSQDLMAQEGPKVLNQSLALKELVQMHEASLNRQKVEAKVSEITGFKSMNDLRTEYPGKFDTEVLEHFEGGSKKQKSVASAGLRSYVASVQASPSTGPSPSRSEPQTSRALFSTPKTDSGSFSVEVANTTELKSVEVIKRDPSVIVLNLESGHSKLIDLVTSTGKQSVILVDNEEDQDIAYDKISSCNTDLVTQKVYFSKKPSNYEDQGNFVNNVEYGVVSGNMFRGKVEILQTDRRSLPRLVEKMSPPKTTALLINEGPKRIPQIHLTGKMKHDAFYLGSKKALKAFGNSQEMECQGVASIFDFSDDEDIPTTSPMKRDSPISDQSYSTNLLA